MSFVKNVDWKKVVAGTVCLVEHHCRTSCDGSSDSPPQEPVRCRLGDVRDASYGVEDQEEGVHDGEADPEGHGELCEERGLEEGSGPVFAFFTTFAAVFFTAFSTFFAALLTAFFALLTVFFTACFACCTFFFSHPWPLGSSRLTGSFPA